MHDMSNFTKFYIGGQWVEPAGRRRLPVENPATEKTVAEITLGTPADVDAAVAAARHAFPTYSKLPVAERIRLFERLLAILSRRRAEIAEITSLEMGAPITFAIEAQTASCIAHAEAIITVLQDHSESELLGSTLVVREPIGVVGLITPWNWPLNQVLTKVLPALASGCTVVLKPSEIAPLDATIFAEVLEEAGFPPGAFNLVNGLGTVVGEAMSGHPDIDMISFTGSTVAGIKVAKAAAETVKRVAQELGGKSANIILDDADLESAVRNGVDGCFANSGQSCDAPTRMLVPRVAYEQAIEFARDQAQRMRLGDPMDPATHLGPVASKQQFEKIQSLIQSGIEAGARLVVGGLGRPEGMSTGYYVKPTIFADVDRDMRIVREEVFGPVLVIIPYDSEGEAIEIANASEYGLAGYVQSGDLRRARRVAMELRAGSIYLNYPAWDVMAPFGGYKQSGNGREAGRYGFAEFFEIKAIVGHGEAER